MLRRSLSHWALFWATLVVVVLGYLGGALIDWWEPIFGAALFKQARDFLFDPANKTKVEWTLKGLGMLGSAVGISYGLLQARRLGERRLPYRLDEYLLKCQSRITRERDDLLAEFAAETSPIRSGKVARTRREQRQYEGRLRAYLATVDSERLERHSDYAELTRRLSIARKAQNSLQDEVATAHFLRGLKLGRAADSQLDTVSSRKRAIDELMTAAALDKTDPRIFKACIAELRKCNPVPDLLPYLQGWLEASIYRALGRDVGEITHDIGEYWLERSEEPGLNKGERGTRLQTACGHFEESVRIIQKNLEGSVRSPWMRVGLAPSATS